MEAQILTVHWHDGEQPVYSAHFQPSASPTTSTNMAPSPSPSQRLATGGGDNNVRIWKLVHPSPGETKVEYLSTLSKHTQAVNAVRFDPTGTMLATAGDDGCAMIWTKADRIVRDFGVEADEEAVESWTVKTLCRSSSSEIYGLDWSPDSKYIITGSTDNKARVYDVLTGQEVMQITDHAHYVQGAAWDPRGKFLATQSADRSVHIHVFKTTGKDMKVSVLQKSARADLPMRQPGAASGKTSETVASDLPPLDFNNIRSSMLYQTESLRSFFRRLSFSPDGSLLLAPAGIYKSSAEDKDEPTNTVYIYTRQGLNKAPIAQLPGFKKPALAISFSPIFYELDSTSTSNAFQLPYKMIYAVAAADTVHIFDTQSTTELGSVSRIHYVTLTDLTWNNDGQSLIVSSADGFCTRLGFTPETFGAPLKADYRTLLPEEALINGTPKSTKRKANGMTTSQNTSPSTVSTTTTNRTIPSSPLAAPEEPKKAVPSPLSKPAPVMNMIDHLIKKKVKPTPVNKAGATAAKSEKPDVEMKDAEPVVHTPPVKQKKRISPTLVTDSTPVSQ
ncbi:Chromatin assembly factor 1 subunit B [Cyberlindnera fabianii]|uniref:Chromatin assembly factor 1 subunit B n=1 Tax=Cyberlindnera fabianii TaxID=36022 RepID=A0A1V2LB69_CYBFA|nr:Chromatin assembly factor 1 subunit B [Cyberlindnera fabianii]